MGSQLGGAAVRGLRVTVGAAVSSVVDAAAGSMAGVVVGAVGAVVGAAVGVAVGAVVGAVVGVSGVHRGLSCLALRWVRYATSLFSAT